MPRKPTITPDQWREVETLAVQGVNYKEISRRLGISVITLRARAGTEDWPTPGRIAHKQRMAGPGVAVAVPQTVTRATGGTGTPAAMVPHLEALQAAAGVNPQAFQKALAGCAEVLIAAGIENIPPPRSVGELAKLNDIYRKASGLDGNRSGGEFRFVRPVRSLRRTPVVEVGEVPDDPLDGFVI